MTVFSTLFSDIILCYYYSIQQNSPDAETQSNEKHNLRLEWLLFSVSFLSITVQSVIHLSFIYFTLLPIPYFVVICIYLPRKYIYENFVLLFLFILIIFVRILDSTLHFFYASWRWKLLSLLLKTIIVEAPTHASDFICIYQDTTRTNAVMKSESNHLK